MPTTIAALPPPGGALPPNADAPAPTASPWGEDGFGFDDLIDIINPLQHIPLVSSLYRAMTGDEIAYAPRMIGSALFGGVLGVIAEGVSAAIEEETGGTPGDHIAAALTGLFGDREPDAVAQAKSTQGAPPRPAPAAVPSNRIQTEIRAARAAQVPLLLASLGLAPPERSGQDDRADRAPHSVAERTARPRPPATAEAKPTPFELMRRALDKYERLQAERRQGAIDLRG